MELSKGKRTGRIRPGYHPRANAFYDDGAAGRITAALVIAVVLLLTGALFAPLSAQTYPNKPIRLILPFPAGGATDILGRLIATKLAERLGQPVVPENRPGAAGNIGTEAAAKSKPDGYTIVLTTPTITISPSLYKKLSYDPIKDLAPISLVAQIPNLILVRPGLPVKNIKEFIEYAKVHPGKLNYGTSGQGSSTHLATVLFGSLAKINLVNVQYKGSNQAMIGLMGGEVDLVVIGPPAAMQHVQSGKVKPLAVLSDERLPMLPNVPTIKEAGLDNCEVTTWYGLLAPAGTPRDIVNRLNAEWLKVVAMPDTKEKMKNAEVDPMSSTPDQFANFIKKETIRWAKVIKENNITID